jgi:hypothetical protein
MGGNASARSCKGFGKRPAVSEGIAPKFEEAINRLLQQNRPKPTWAFVARPEEDEVFGWRVRSTV